MTDDQTNKYRNDYDRIADQLEEAILDCIGALRIASKDSGDGMSINNEQFMEAMRELKSLHGWVEGLADSHRREKFARPE